MRPPSYQRVLLLSVVGVALGIGAFTFIYAKGFSYMTNDPAACANCHIMDDHFDAWLSSSHQAVAVCNDCHTPSGFAAKYWTKAENGFWHSLAFTTGNFPDPLRIKPGNLEVTEEACMKCHQGLTATIVPGPHLTGTGSRAEPEDEGLACIRCHDAVGHWVR
jgi:cytochrome c nitrite reductase small subunit